MAGGRESVVTDYMLKLLGLDVCAGALLIVVILSSAASIPVIERPIQRHSVARKATHMPLCA